MNSRGQQEQSSSLAPKAQTQIDGRKASKGTGPQGRESFWNERSESVKNYLKGTCTNPSYNYWHPPVCQNYVSDSGCKFGDKCLFRHTEPDRQPTKKSGGKGSVALLEKSEQLVSVSQ